MWVGKDPHRDNNLGYGVVVHAGFAKPCDPGSNPGILTVPFGKLIGTQTGIWCRG